MPTSFEMTGGDPHTSTGDTASTIISLLHDGLCVKLVDGKIHPAIAKSWTVEPNWKFVTFKLNRSAKFHDNTPVTAEDVKYSLDRVKRLKGYFKPVFDKYIDRVEVVDPDTVKVYLKMPMVGIFSIFAKYIGIVPKHYVEKVGDVAYAQKPIGAGPFKALDIKQDVHVKVEAVANHYRKTPNVKNLNLLFIAESATRYAMIKSGEADVSWADSPTYMSILKDPTLKIIMSKYTYLRTLAFYDLAFPEEKSPFLNLRVRQAAAYAIDYKGITQNVMHGTGEPYGTSSALCHRIRSIHQALALRSCKSQGPAQRSRIPQRIRHRDNQRRAGQGRDSGHFRQLGKVGIRPGQHPGARNLGSGDTREKVERPGLASRALVGGLFTPGIVSG